MKLFKITKHTITCRAISIVIVISFVSSMLFVQTAKAEFTSTFDNIFQLIFKPLVSINEAEVIVVEPELPMKEWVLQKVAEAGLNPREAEAIINCESRWDPEAMGVNNNRTVDLGLWQINSIHKDITSSEKLDYKKATEWAINKRLKDGSWRAWVCSRKIAFLK